ncbi:MHC class II regulatory factor RFX1-like [Salmo trutta]|uniref:MHC class II regulatory factor RFX1-like n=1 Tax=Salmo trutta TaxID=8032 RepID=UPI001130A010|nr:MHC class II regulatory factor RFX1-like [Salmo trutta]
MVIREIILRSAASFRSFHLIRLLYDEYMYNLIEHRVAQAKGETAIAVMGEFASVGRSLNSQDPDKDEEEDEEESLEPPVRLARTDPQGLFNSTHTE